MQGYLAVILLGIARQMPVYEFQLKNLVLFV